MTLLEILQIVLVLIAAYGSQVYLVKRTVAFVKKGTKIKGLAVRWVSFAIGFVIGGFFLWPWIVFNTGLHVSVYLLVSVLFLLTAGLVASGDYDLEHEKKS